MRACERPQLRRADRSPVDGDTRYHHENDGEAVQFVCCGGVLMRVLLRALASGSCSGGSRHRSMLQSVLQPEGYMVHWVVRVLLCARSRKSALWRVGDPARGQASLSADVWLQVPQ